MITLFSEMRYYSVKSIQKSYTASLLSYPNFGMVKAELNCIGGKDRRDKGGLTCWKCGKSCHVCQNCPHPQTGCPGRSYRSITVTSNSALIVDGVVEGRPGKMLIDSGSAVTFLCEDVWKAACTKPWESRENCTTSELTQQCLKLPLFNFVQPLCVVGQLCNGSIHIRVCPFATTTGRPGVSKLHFSGSLQGQEKGWVRVSTIKETTIPSMRSGPNIMVYSLAQLLSPQQLRQCQHSLINKGTYSKVIALSATSTDARGTIEMQLCMCLFWQQGKVGTIK